MGAYRGTGDRSQQEANSQSIAQQPALHLVIVVIVSVGGRMPPLTAFGSGGARLANVSLASVNFLRVFAFFTRGDVFGMRAS